MRRLVNSPARRMFWAPMRRQRNHWAWARSSETRRLARGKVLERTSILESERWSYGRHDCRLLQAGLA